MRGRQKNVEGLGQKGRDTQGSFFGPYFGGKSGVIWT